MIVRAVPGELFIVHLQQCFYVGVSERAPVSLELKTSRQSHPNLAEVHSTCVLPTTCKSTGPPTLGLYRADNISLRTIIVGMAHQYCQYTIITLTLLGIIFVWRMAECTHTYMDTVSHSGGFCTSSKYSCLVLYDITKDCAQCHDLLSYDSVCVP